jgi:hypothetical protein
MAHADHVRDAEVLGFELRRRLGAPEGLSILIVTRSRMMSQV